MSQMLKSSGAMGLATLISRMLGLVREQVYAAFMGTSAVAGAFQMAFTVPNLFRRLLGEGALTAAFIPIFKAKEKTEGEQEMWRSANVVISGLVVSAAAVVGLVLLGITLVLSWSTLPESTQLMLRLLQVMFPYMLLVCLAAVLMGMLNARGYFFIPAFGAAMLNVVMIGSVLWLAPRMGEELEEQIFGLAVGVLVAGVAQAGFQVPALWRQGFRFRWVRPWGDPTLMEVVKKMLPASVGVAAFQINVLVTQSLAFGVHAPIVAAFNYAVRLMEFPQGLFGISLATYMLPTLSGLAAEKDYDRFRATLREGLSYLVFLNLLASAMLMALAAPVVRLLFEYGRFGPSSTAAVAVALGCLAPGLVAFSSVNIVARAFYAVGDTTTPMRVSVFCLAVNILLTAMFLLALDLGAAGLAVANSMTSYLNLALLLYALRRKLAHLGLAPLGRTLLPSLGAAVLAGLCAWGLASWLEQRMGHAGIGVRMLQVFAPLIVAGLAYGLLCYWAGVPAVKEIWSTFAGRLGRNEKR
jgi:putative peptidoglycan lipid II flippase